MTNNNTNNGLAIQANGTDTVSYIKTDVDGQLPRVSYPAAQKPDVMYTDITVRFTPEYLGMEPLFTVKNAGVFPHFQMEIGCSVGMNLDQRTAQSAVFDTLVKDAIAEHPVTLAYKAAQAELWAAEKGLKDYAAVRAEAVGTEELRRIEETFQARRTGRLGALAQGLWEQEEVRLNARKDELVQLAASYDAEHRRPYSEKRLQQLKDATKRTRKQYRYLSDNYTPPYKEGGKRGEREEALVRDPIALETILKGLGVGAVRQHQKMMEILQDPSFGFAVVGSTDELPGGTRQISIPFQEVLSALETRNVPHAGKRFISFFPSTERGIPGLDGRVRNTLPTFLVIDRTTWTVILIPGAILNRILATADQVLQSPILSLTMQLLYPHESQKRLKADLALQKKGLAVSAASSAIPVRSIRVVEVPHDPSPAPGAAG